MENKERFTNSNENLDRNKTEHTDLNRLEEENLENRDQPIDLDGDGMIGNTGGFYGGTSYVGSNYGADWNADDNSRHEGNYGAAGQKDSTDITDSKAREERDHANNRNDKEE